VKKMVRMGLAAATFALLSVFALTVPAMAQASGPPTAPTGQVDPGITADELIAQITATQQAAAAAAAAEASADEVLGVTVTPDLAFTGSTVNTPLAIGSTMIGAGGLLILVARKREKEA